MGNESPSIVDLFAELATCKEESKIIEIERQIIGRKDVTCTHLTGICTRSSNEENAMSALNKAPKAVCEVEGVTPIVFLSSIVLNSKLESVALAAIPLILAEEDVDSTIFKAMLIKENKRENVSLALIEAFMNTNFCKPEDLLRVSFDANYESVQKIAREKAVSMQVDNLSLILRKD